MLPLHPTIFWLRAFYLVHVGVFVVVGAASAVLHAPSIAAVCAALALGAAVLAARAQRGVVGPALFRAYVRITGLIGRAVRAVAQLACFAIVTAVGVTGSNLEVHRPPRQSMWRSKHSLDTDAYAATFAGRAAGQPGGWARAYVSWARRSRNTWALALLPFLALQRSAQPPNDSEVRGEIYTLY